MIWNLVFFLLVWAMLYCNTTSKNIGCKGSYQFQHSFYYLDSSQLIPNRNFPKNKKLSFSYSKKTMTSNLSSYLYYSGFAKNCLQKLRCDQLCNFIAEIYPTNTNPFLEVDSLIREENKTNEEEKYLQQVFDKHIEILLGIPNPTPEEQAKLLKEIAKLHQDSGSKITNLQSFFLKVLISSLATYLIFDAIGRTRLGKMYKKIVQKLLQLILSVLNASVSYTKKEEIRAAKEAMKRYEEQLEKEDDQESCSLETDRLGKDMALQLLRLQTANRLFKPIKDEKFSFASRLQSVNTCLLNILQKKTTISYFTATTYFSLQRMFSSTTRSMFAKSPMFIYFILFSSVYGINASYWIHGLGATGIVAFLGYLAKQNPYYFNNEDRYPTLNKIGQMIQMPQASLLNIHQMIKTNTNEAGQLVANIPNRSVMPKQTIRTGWNLFRKIIKR